MQTQQPGEILASCAKVSASDQGIRGFAEAPSSSFTRLFAASFDASRGPAAAPPPSGKAPAGSGPSSGLRASAPSSAASAGGPSGPSSSASPGAAPFAFAALAFSSSCCRHSPFGFQGGAWISQHPLVSAPFVFRHLSSSMRIGWRMGFGGHCSAVHEPKDAGETAGMLCVHMCVGEGGLHEGECAKARVSARGRVKWEATRLCTLQLNCITMASEYVRTCTGTFNQPVQNRGRVPTLAAHMSAKSTCSYSCGLLVKLASFQTADRGSIPRLQDSVIRLSYFHSALSHRFS